MPDTTSTAMTVAFTVVAVVALIAAVRRTLRDRDQWSFGALIGAFVVILTFSFVQVLVTYTDTWVKTVDVNRVESVAVPEWALACLRLVMVFTAVGALALFVRGMRQRDAQVNIPAVLLVTVLFISMASAIVRGGIPLQPFSIVYACILVACVFAPRGLSVHLGIALVCMVAAIASGFAIVANSDFSVVECIPGTKCGVLGFKFRGVLDNENAFALYLGLAMPFVYIGFRGWEGIVMASYLVFLILLSGSRSGALAGLCTLAVLLLLRPDIRRPTRAPVRSAILGVGLAGIFATGLLLPLLVTDAEAMSGRGDLWQLARSELLDPQVFTFGAGMFGWTQLHEIGLVDTSAMYSVHNQWLHVAYSTGMVGFLCFVAAIAVLIWQARHGYFLVVGSVLLPLFFLSITERPWPIDTADWLTWAVPGALLCYPLSKRDENVRAGPKHAKMVGAGGEAR